MKSLLALLLFTLVAACGTVPPPAAQPPVSSALRLTALETDLREIIRRHSADTVEVAVAVLDLASGDSLLIDGHTMMHAASTMKVPVMLQLYRMADAGEISLDDPVLVRNEFRSIADGSTYTLSVSDDSEGALYRQIGQRVPMRELVEPMITRSSNLATNILIELADPTRIARTLEQLGAGEMRALRGVEDIPAFRQGMNNTTTAYGYMKVLEAIARGTAASPHATKEMIGILTRQEFRELIPEGLPPGVRVGNKTGWITGINHDGAIVLPDDREPYVLVVLTRGFREPPAAEALARGIAARVYAALVEGR